MPACRRNAGLSLSDGNVTGVQSTARRRAAQLEPPKTSVLPTVQIRDLRVRRQSAWHGAFYRKIRIELSPSRHPPRSEFSLLPRRCRAYLAYHEFPAFRRSAYGARAIRGGHRGAVLANTLFPATTSKSEARLRGEVSLPIGP